MALHEAGEDYLEAIYILEKNMSEVRSVNLAEFLGYKRPSITNMIKILIHEEMVTKDSEGIIKLTEKGKKVAKRTYEKYRFFLKILKDAGVEQSLARKEACKMEHDLTDESFQKLKKSFKKMHR